MTGKLKYILLTKRGTEDKIAPGYRSMRYDPQIWEEWRAIDDETASLIEKLIPGGNVNPGNFALYRLDASLLESGYPDSKIKIAFLEECMNEYQLFLQETEKPIDLLQAAKLAVVLIEQRKISENWNTVLTEITTRFRGKNTQEFVGKWQTVIGILENLIVTYEELITSFGNPEIGELLKGLYIPAIMMLCQSDKERLAIAAQTLMELKIQDQLAILTELVEIGEDSLATEIARKIISKYSDIDLSSKSKEAYWDRPFETQSSVPFNQSLALVAHIAGDEELEERILIKTEEMLNAAHEGIEIQKAGLKIAEIGGVPDSKELVSLLTLNVEEPSAGQLSFFENNPLNEQTVEMDTALEVTKLAKNVADFGNKEVALGSLMESYNKNPEEFIKELLEKKPRFNPTWQSYQSAKELIEIGAYQPAEIVVNRLIKNNPANIQAVNSAIQIKKATGNRNEFIDLLEESIYCGKPTADDLRELVTVEIDLGRKNEAYEVSEMLLQADGVTSSDRIQHANIALAAGKQDVSRKILTKILTDEPENVEALCASGKINIDENKLEDAETDLKKATEFSVENSLPWLLLSDLYTLREDISLAIVTLNKGLIALPENRDVKFNLARLMMNQGMTAEALTLLQELHGSTEDAKSDLLLLKAMKKLHHDDLDEYVAESYVSYPDNPEIAYEFATLKLKYGNYKEAGKVLKGIHAPINMNPEWCLTYADALAGLDPRHSKNAKQLLDCEIEEALGIIAPVDQAEEDLELCIKGLKAELLLQKGLVAEAHSLLEKILEKGNKLSGYWFTRVQTWFAWTSAMLGKSDIALRAIKDVIDSDPSLLGAQQVLAEILALSGDTQEAVAQAQLVVELAPDLAENLLWVGEFLTNLGEIEKGLQVITDGSKLYSEDLRFDLSLAEIYAMVGEIGEANLVIDAIKDKVDQQTDCKTLISFSRIMDKYDDSNVIENILQDHFDQQSDTQNALNLAGYLYQHNNTEKALNILESACGKNPNNLLMNCFRADILANLTKYGDALLILEEQKLINVPQEIIETNGFCPSNWLLLKQSKAPVEELTARVLFDMGKIQESLKVSEKILDDDKQNSHAWLLGYESALALKNQEAIKKLNEFIFVNNEDTFYTYTVVEKLERQLDNNQIDGCWDILNTLDEGIKGTPAIQLIEAKLLFIEGNLAEADATFSKCVKELVEDNNSSSVLRGINTRLMVKIAIALSRWYEALTWIKQIAEQLPWNKYLSEIYLSALVQAIEFADLADSLQISVHTPAKVLSSIDALQEMDWIRNNLEGDETCDRWFLRGKLALQPDQQLVKAYALYKPTAEDAKVLMRALTKIGQVSTAEQIGKKFGEDCTVLLESVFLNLENNREFALAAVNKLLETKINNPIALTLRSQLFENLQKTEQAAADIESALLLWPDEMLWHKKASELWTSLGNDQKSIRHLEIAKDQNPSDIDTGIKLAKNYFSKKEYSACIELLNDLTKEDPNKFEIWECLTDAQLAAGQINEALDSAEIANRVNPFSIKPYLIRAEIDLDNGLLDEAYEQVLQADEKVKGNGEVKVFLAKVLHAKGEKTAALAELENATQCENLTPRTILEEIRLIKEINGTASARNLIEYFAKKMPENTDLLALLAESQLENGDSHAAEVTARRVLKLKPDSIDMLLFIGKQQIKKGQLDQAIHSFSQVVNLDEKKIEAYYALGTVFEEQRETSKAIDTLKRIIEINPNEVAAYLKMAEIYKDSKNYKMAEEMLKNAVEIEPKNVAIKRQLGALLALNLVHQSQEVSSQI